MAKRSASKSGRAEDRARERVSKAVEALAAHPLFAPFSPRGLVSREPLGRSTWSTVTAQGSVRCDTRLAEVEEWIWVIAHQLCHLGMGHLRSGRRIERDGHIDSRWNAACCVEVDRFLSHLKIGRSPLAIPELPPGDAESLWRRWRDTDAPDASPGLYGVAEHGDLAATGRQQSWRATDWERCFAEGLRAAVSAAVEVAGGERDSLSGRGGSKTAWRRALEWFVASYPLLGGIAAGLRLVEDAERCRVLSVGVAAVDVSSGEVIVNPHVVLSGPERRFVIAHEILHAGLRHDTRAGGRDPWLWNVATDLVINGWLVEMGVGELPDGTLYDPRLKGWSADEVYERIVKDLRRFARVATFAGVGVVDVLPGDAGPGRVDLDGFYRRALANGLDYHTSSGRGLLPAGLVEEIRARSHPPIGWEVELARWFDDWLPAAERLRTYARVSRRQSATPDIPRPALVKPEEWQRTRTFGAVIDTSGSMDPDLLGKALGAVASYSAAREVSRARVVFCDAAAYDAGWLAPDEIAGRVRVRGRGGTVLQPGIDLLERSADFPATGPVLVITDGHCDRLSIRREHAFLIPHGRRLPFTPKGPVFRMT
jgi:predicted metal-dependent peptidase